jgi:hypothetical protein
MAINYFWNIQLSEALYPALAALEIALRNAIHDSLSAAFGTPEWFYTPRLLEPRQLRDFSQARLSLYREHGNTPAIGLIVAQLNFGFWTTLLSTPYHGSIWNVRGAAHLKAAFPYVPGPHNYRKAIHKRYNDVRFLRNRVMHHEPIWARPALAREHADILEAIAWINPQLLTSVTLCDRFPDVFARGRRTIEQAIKAQFGFP